jgi:colicin import membrane protein
VISLPRIRIDWTEPGIVVSGTAHVALLLAAVVSFSQTKPFQDAQEAVAVEMMSASQFSQITKGEQTAKEVKPEPKPRADKVAEVQELKPEAVELKRDVPAPPPRPQETPPEPRPVALPTPTPPQRPRDTVDDQKARAEADARARAEAEKAAAARAEAAAKAKAEADAQAKAEAAREEAEALEKARLAKAQAEAKARAEAKAKADAEAKAKAEAEAEQRRKEAELARQKAAEAQKLAALAEQAKEQPKPAAPKPVPPKPDSKFDVANIEKLLTSKEAPQQAPSTAKEVNRTASLGAPKATGVKLTPSQADALSGIIRDQVTKVWSPPPGLTENATKPTLRIRVNPDGTLAAEPVVLSATNDAASRALAESAVRAVKRAAPFRIPPQFLAAHDDWGDWKLNFDPKDLL